MYDYLEIARKTRPNRDRPKKFETVKGPQRSTSSRPHARERSELSEERKTSDAGDQCGLVIRWARERGWIALRDPLTGEWHEVRASDCLPSIVETANAAKRRTKNNTKYGGAT